MQIYLIKARIADDNVIELVGTWKCASRRKSAKGKKIANYRKPMNYGHLQLIKW